MFWNNRKVELLEKQVVDLKNANDKTQEDISFLKFKEEANRKAFKNMESLCREMVVDALNDIYKSSERRSFFYKREGDDLFGQAERAMSREALKQAKVAVNVAVNGEEFIDALIKRIKDKQLND